MKRVSTRRRALLTLMTLCVVSLNSSPVAAQSGAQQGTTNAQAAMVYNQAVHLMDANNLNDALPLLQQATALDPSFYQAYQAYGWALHRTNHYSEAVAPLLKCVQANPDNKDAWIDLEGCYQSLGDLQGLVTATRNLLRLTPPNDPQLPLIKHNIDLLEKQIAASNSSGGAADYFDAVENVGLARFSRMPVKVYIGKPNLPNFNDNLMAILKQAFEEWSRASEGHVSFVYVSDPSTSQINCSWTDDPNKLADASEGGHTELAYAGSNIAGATIILLVPSGAEPAETARLADLHEIGHALGLQHSPNIKDIMFPVAKRTRADLTGRDIRTLIALYTADQGLMASHPVDLSKSVQIEPGSEMTIPVRVAKLNIEAGKEIQAHDYASAEAKLKQALSLKAGDETSMGNLAVIYSGQAHDAWKAGDMAKAAQFCKQSVDALSATRFKEQLLQQLKIYQQVLTQLHRADEASAVTSRIQQLQSAN